MIARSRPSLAAPRGPRTVAFLLGLAVGLPLLGPAGPAAAQDPVPAETLSCGSRVDGITEAGDFVFGVDVDRFFYAEDDVWPDADVTPFDLYAVPLAAGQTATVNLTSPVFDTFLIVFAPDLEELTFNDDAVPNDPASGSRSRFTAPTTGDYYLLVTGFSEADFGDYALSVDCSGPRFNVSGLWFDPAAEGEGYNVIQSPAGVTVFYYGYGQAGGRLWLVTETLDAEVVPGETVTLEVFVGEPGTFTAPTPASGLQSWGTLGLRVDDCDSGRFELSGADGSKVSQVARLAAVLGTECAAVGRAATAR